MPNSHNQSRRYNRFNFAENGKTLLTGIRPARSKNVYISGWYEGDASAVPIAFVYRGPLKGCGRFFPLNFPSAAGSTVTATNLYGPDALDAGQIRVVGNYTVAEQAGALGALYQGSLDGSGTWTKLVPTPLASEPILNTIAHSTMNGLVVGNFSTEVGRARAFLYDISTDKYYEISQPEAASLTAYGIWFNGGSLFTICGGFFDKATSPEQAYLLDWDSESKSFSNFRVFSYKNQHTQDLYTHFNGISADEDRYYLTGDAGILSQPPLPRPENKAFIAVLLKKSLKPKWNEVAFPRAVATSGNSVIEKKVIGVYVTPNGLVRGYTSNSRSEVCLCHWD